MLRKDILASSLLLAYLMGNTNSHALQVHRHRPPAVIPYTVGKHLARATAKHPEPVEDASHTAGQGQGLHKQADALKLSTGAAILVDADTRQVLFSKNADAVLPMASITKLMTAMVVIDSGAPYDQVITVTQEDVDTEKNSTSRLAVGTKLTRAEMLHLALMSSENRAAHALARNHPQGLQSFMQQMNEHAQALGLRQTRYEDPTGLSQANRSSPADLAKLVQAASQYDAIRIWSTTKEGSVDVMGRKLSFHNSNELVRNGAWEIVVQKTGYIREAGRCVAMEVQSEGKHMVMVLMNSMTSHTRSADARKLHDYALRVWPAAHQDVAAQPTTPAPLISRQDLEQSSEKSAQLMRYESATGF